MANYIWLPVYTEEMLNIAIQWNNGLRDKGKPECKLLYTPIEKGILKWVHRNRTGGCLRNVRPEDKLYILAHGSGVANGRRIGATRTKDGLMKGYTPEELVNVIIKENLTRRICEINLYCCGSGLGNESSYAARLKKSLLAKGFTTVIVSGYLGDLVTSYVNRYKTVSGGSFTHDTHKGVTVGDIVKYTIPASQKKVKF
ncbi:hypothetical protein DVH07_18370 [Hafnia paralvei]|uniref:hypothetical protein n=1 Tax=Hafnia paralvei TaxID=546367 RepID=UPI000DF47B35|nr:hypothetical protein [Hafnia paralvei]RDA61915.1 hypothetical protein DU449_17930 [Hafnia paralvei]RDA62976.1 hypothetical protein DVH08_20140 [Hafnia paralvei]RDA63816.1 hypothetical protein DVH09_18500 [Hafnia paralvei]RDA75102.1 hypothetical protein DVH10_17670 [Hafnia paralvei]RDA75506.1 hypothetical protein DVH07_18370 [Hafnia paralvei]